jgi:hypothetical protein
MLAPLGAAPYLRLMIEADAETEAELREAVRLAKSYAADSLQAEGIEDFSTLPRETFIARCHEGFHLNYGDTH